MPCKVPGSKFKRRSIVYTPTLPHSYTPKKSLVTSHLEKLLHSQNSSKFKVQGSKFKRRSIVYTPTLPHSYTPKKSLVTSHLNKLLKE